MAGGRPLYRRIFLIYRSRLWIFAAPTPNPIAEQCVAAAQTVFHIQPHMLDAKYIFDNFLIIPKNTGYNVKLFSVRRVIEGNGVPLKGPNAAILLRQDLNRDLTDGTFLLEKQDSDEVHSKHTG